MPEDWKNVITLQNACRIKIIPCLWFSTTLDPKLLLPMLVFGPKIWQGKNALKYFTSNVLCFSAPPMAVGAQNSYLLSPGKVLLCYITVRGAAEKKWKQESLSFYSRETTIHHRNIFLAHFSLDRFGGGGSNFWQHYYYLSLLLLMWCLCTRHSK